MVAGDLTLCGGYAVQYTDVVTYRPTPKPTWSCCPMPPPPINLTLKKNQKASLCSYQPRLKGVLVKQFPRLCSICKCLRLLWKTEKEKKEKAYCLSSHNWQSISTLLFILKCSDWACFQCINLGELLHSNGFHAGKLHFGITKGPLMLCCQLTKLVSIAIVLHLAWWMHYLTLLNSRCYYRLWGMAWGSH